MKCSSFKGLINELYIVLHPSQEYFTCEDAIITFEGLQSLGLCPAFMAMEQGTIFIVPQGSQFFILIGGLRFILLPLATCKWH
jgi:hypothetical protein